MQSPAQMSGAFLFLQSMKLEISNGLFVMLVLLLSSLSSCYELQSDEELRKDIIGIWQRNTCKYPNNTEEPGITEPSPLRPRMTFFEDGRFIESGGSAYCTLDTCSSIWSNSDCRCEWQIQNGKLLITSLASGGASHLNREYPIKCLRKDLLVFDNVSLSVQGFSYQAKKACYCRQ